METSRDISSCICNRLLTCRKWRTSRRSKPRKNQLPKDPRSLCGAYEPIWSCVSEFHCRMGHWQKVCSCRVCSSQTLRRWIKLVCILLKSTCIDHRTKDHSGCDRKHTSRTLFLCGGRYEWGRYQHRLEERVVCIFLPRMVLIHPIRRFLARGSQWCRP